MSELYEQMFTNYCSYRVNFQNYTSLIGGGGFHVSKDRSHITINEITKTNDSYE